MMYAVEVLTAWRTFGADNEMAVVVDYPASWSDATGQTDANIPPTPNLFIAEGVVEDATLAILDADTNFLVLTAEPFVVAQEVDGE